MPDDVPIFASPAAVAGSDWRTPLALLLASTGEGVFINPAGARMMGCGPEQVRELAAGSEAVREEERTRMAREVHDELGSLLVALKMDVNWMDKRLSEQDPRSAEAADDMRLRLRGKCQNMSRLIEPKPGSWPLASATNT